MQYLLQRDVPLQNTEILPPSGDAAAANDICGQNNANKVAADTRTAETWKKYDMDNYLKSAVDLFETNEWYYDSEKKNKCPDIQSAILYLMGNQGAEKCDELSNVGCSGTGLDFELCKKNPKAHFVWFALTHYAQFLEKLKDTFDSNAIEIGFSTSTLVSQFFVAEDAPESLLMPVSIITGLGAAISSVFPPGALVAGAGTVASGIITQEGLNKPDPLKQWGLVQTALGQTYGQIVQAIDEFFDAKFHEEPVADYSSAAGEIPTVLKDGFFASPVKVGALNNNVKGALAASAINALWIQDKVIIIKISDRAYGSGDGGACGAYPDLTICIDGIAYVFVRWQVKEGGKDAGWPTMLWEPDWFVFGLSEIGKSGAGEPNKYVLPEYGLSMHDIAVSSEKTQKEYGFLYDNQNSDTIDRLKQNPTDLDAKDLLFWNLPVCDIDAIIGKDRHLNDPAVKENIKFKHTKLQFWALCTCIQAKDWPVDDYGDGTNSGTDAIYYDAQECRDKGWGSNEADGTPIQAPDPGPAPAPDPGIIP